MNQLFNAFLGALLGQWNNDKDKKKEPTPDPKRVQEIIDEAEEHGKHFRKVLDEAFHPGWRRHKHHRHHI